MRQFSPFTTPWCEKRHHYTFIPCVPCSGKSSFFWHTRYVTLYHCNPIYAQATMTPPRVSAKIPGGAIKKIIHGCLEVWNFSLRAQLDISPVRCAHSWDVQLNTPREIHYFRAPMFYFLEITILQHVLSDAVKDAALWFFFFSALNLFFCFQVNRVIVIQSCYYFLKQPRHLIRHLQCLYNVI